MTELEKAASEYADRLKREVFISEWEEHVVVYRIGEVAEHVNEAFIAGAKWMVENKKSNHGK